MLNGPLSTSTEPQVAFNFGAGNELVLELQYKFSEYPLLSKYFDCSFFSDFVNEKECLFIGGIPMLIITNIINISQNNKNYKKYIKSVNTIDSMMNGTYHYQDNNKNDENKKLLVDLLNHQINAHHNNQQLNIPNYISTIFAKYCLRLNTIIILWDNIFSKSGKMNIELMHLLFDKDINYLFFDLNKLLMLFPNIIQIEFYKQS